MSFIGPLELGYFRGRGQSIPQMSVRRNGSGGTAPQKLGLSVALRILVLWGSSEPSQ